VRSLQVSNWKEGLGTVLIKSQQVSNWKEGLLTAEETVVSFNEKPTIIQLEGGAWESLGNWGQF